MKNINPKTILFDLDDTLLQTNTVFADKCNAVIKILSDDLKLPQEQVKEIFEKANVQSRQTSFVNPNKCWPTTLSLVYNQCKFSDDAYQKSLDTFKTIYKTPVEAIEGAIELLELCKRKNIPLGLVTHAQRRWTNFKLKNSPISQYFAHVEVVNMNREKKSKDWLKAFQVLNTLPEEGMVVGDNIKGDILAGEKIGAKYLVWYDRVETWSHYRAGELPKKVITINNLNQLKELLS